MTNKEFVPKELAIKLRDLAFDEPCLFVYRHNDLYMYGGGDYLTTMTLVTNFQLTNPADKNYWVTAPTYSQAFRWFRENHNLDVEITRGGRAREYYVFADNYIYDEYDTNNLKSFSYDDAQKAALGRLIEIVEERKAKQPEPVRVVEKTPHTLLIYSIMNERLYANGYPPITFGEAVQMGLTEETQERDITFILVKKFP